jgi:NAD(P)-dependent dehydrogenase (short-subunit alcohol dehydrogenase family)
VDDGAPWALVTGASRGIGRAVALRLADDGLRVLPTARGGEGLEAVAEGCGTPPALTADLTREEDVTSLAREAARRAGGAPALLVNVAGVFGLAPVEETSPQAFDAHLAVNLRAPFLLARRLLPELRDRGRGHLIHLGSVAGRRALPGNAAYGSSKFGLRGLHRILREELQGSGVCSTLVEPGPVDTGAWDPVEDRLGRDLPPREAMLDPGQVAEAVASAVRWGPLGRGGSPDVISLTAG